MPWVDTTLPHSIAVHTPHSSNRAHRKRKKRNKSEKSEASPKAARKVRLSITPGPNAIQNELNEKKKQ